MVYKVLNYLISDFFLTLVCTTVLLTKYVLATLFLNAAKFVTASEYLHLFYFMWRIFAN